jgi:hypothetical protein
MSLKSTSRCGTTITSPIDAVVFGYLTRREESFAVAATYESWMSARSDTRAIAFTEYVAALDREERAACEYQRLLKQAAAA